MANMSKEEMHNNIENLKEAALLLGIEECKLMHIFCSNILL